MIKHVVDLNDEKMLISALREEEWSEGEYCREFENMFASYIGTKYAVVTTNCTYAFKMALRSIGVKEGDEVIVPAITWPSMIIIILELKAKPVIVDVTNNFQMEKNTLAKKLTSNTKAILATHLYGCFEDVPKLRSIIENRNISIIEDFAHASGYLINGVRLGSMGDISVTSFNSKKVLACGEGGCLLTNSPQIYHKVCALKEVNETSILTRELSYNYLISEFQAAVLISQLRKLDTILSIEEETANLVHARLKDIKYIETLRDFANVERRVYYSFIIIIHKDINIEDLCAQVNKLCGKFISRIYIPLISSELFFDGNKPKYLIDHTNTPNASWLYEHSIRFHHSFLLNDKEELLNKIEVLLSVLDKM